MGQFENRQLLALFTNKNVPAEQKITIGAQTLATFTRTVCWCL